MSVASLFQSVQEYDRSRVVRLVEKLVKSAREDYARLQDYEAEFGPSLVDPKDDEAALQLFRSIWSLYETWARDAEQVLARVDELEASGHVIPARPDLARDLGFTLVRLKVDPASIIRGKQQARRGEAIPVEVLRHELRRRRGA
jgi:hypothetical protein